MGFSRQEYWSGLVCPPPWDLSDPGITPASPAVPVLQADSLPLSHWGSCEKGTEIIINDKIKMAVRSLDLLRAVEIVTCSNLAGEIDGQPQRIAQSIGSKEIKARLSGD